MPYIKKAEEFKKKDLARNLAWLHRGIADGTLFGAGVGTNPLNSDMNILHSAKRVSASATATIIWRRMRVMPKS